MFSCVLNLKFRVSRTPFIRYVVLSEICHKFLLLYISMIIVNIHFLIAGIPIFLLDMHQLQASLSLSLISAQIDNPYHHHVIYVPGAQLLQTYRATLYLSPIICALQSECYACHSLAHSPIGWPAVT